MRTMTRCRFPAGSSWPRFTDVVARAALCLALIGGLARYADAQPAEPSAYLAEAAVTADPSGETVTLFFFNRPIVTLRARVLGRGPGERAAKARQTLDELVAQRLTQPVETRPFAGATLVTVGGRGVVAITPADLDELSGESPQQIANAAVARLQQALAEAEEARMPARLLRSGALAIAGVTVGILLLVGIGRARRAAAARVVALAESSITRSGIADARLLRASRLSDLERGIVTAIAVGLQAAVAYAMLTFVLRRFPFTRPWGETMRGFLIDTVKDLALSIAGAIPGVFTILLILLLTRFVVRLIGFWFNAMERGRAVTPRWLHPETALPTRRLLTAAAWLFALVMIYPYVPGSQTDAFKGVSVLVGLMVTLGSSGLVTQMMNSFVITYSRALRMGDFVRIGDVEGTVTQLGMLSTKVRTVWSEEVTIPNAVVVSQTTMDYSRLVDAGGVFTRTAVTIGYDTPWRQIHELLLRAAAQTPGIRREPKPFVLQTGLQDYYVEYTLLVSLERQDARPFTMAALHANIQDQFNEYGVQIMSPHYVWDPASPKIVRKKDWFAPPAAGDPAAAAVAAGSRASSTR